MICVMDNLNILVFNCGSSSLTYKVFEVRGQNIPKALLSGKAHRVGVKGTEASFIENKYNGEVEKKEIPINTHREALDLALRYMRDVDISIDYIGHRFVHGGREFNKTVFINDQVFNKLEMCLPLAPIHNPNSLSLIKAVRELLPAMPQFAAFDTVFHSQIPYQAYTYVLPERIIEEFGFRKYGFHGLSYSHVVKEAARILGKRVDAIKIIACHLGTGGASVAAIKGGHSVDTSMGYSPLPGLVMSTRCGDIDPMLTLYLMVKYGYRPDDLLNVLNKESGLLGVSGISSDIRDIMHRFSEEEEQVGLAFNMYIQRLKKYIGSYIAAMEGVDVLIFTDDIGIHNPEIRAKVCENMDWAGITLDKKKNDSVTDKGICHINADTSVVDILTVPTEEEFIICLEGIKLIRGGI